MTTQERQFFTAVLFSACRHWRATRSVETTFRPVDHAPHLSAAIDHIALALRTPAFEVVR
jgi:hypothetical protein